MAEKKLRKPVQNGNLQTENHQSFPKVYLSY